MHITIFLICCLQANFFFKGGICIIVYLLCDCQKTSYCFFWNKTQPTGCIAYIACQWLFHTCWISSNIFICWRKSNAIEKMSFTSRRVKAVDEINSQNSQHWLWHRTANHTWAEERDGCNTETCRTQMYLYINWMQCYITDGMSEVTQLPQTKPGILVDDLRYKLSPSKRQYIWKKKLLPDGESDNKLSAASFSGSSRPEASKCSEDVSETTLSSNRFEGCQHGMPLHTVREGMTLT